jgi:hypothetical protein
MEGIRYMHHDARGERGPYTAVHAFGPWYCMVPEGVAIPEGSSVLSSHGQVPAEELHLFGKVGWASDRSLRNNCDARGVGWEQVA